MERARRMLNLTCDRIHRLDSGLIYLTSCGLFLIFIRQLTVVCPQSNVQTLIGDVIDVWFYVLLVVFIILLVKETSDALADDRIVSSGTQTDLILTVRSTSQMTIESDDEPIQSLERRRGWMSSPRITAHSLSSQSRLAGSLYDFLRSSFRGTRKIIHSTPRSETTTDTTKSENTSDTTSISTNAFEAENDGDRSENEAEQEILTDEDSVPFTPTYRYSPGSSSPCYTEPEDKDEEESHPIPFESQTQTTEPPPTPSVISTKKQEAEASMFQRFLNRLPKRKRERETSDQHSEPETEKPTKLPPKSIEEGNESEDGFASIFIRESDDEEPPPNWRSDPSLNLTSSDQDISHSTPCQTPKSVSDEEEHVSALSTSSSSTTEHSRARSPRPKSPSKVVAVRSQTQEDPLRKPHHHHHHHHHDDEDPLRKALPEKKAQVVESSPEKIPIEKLIPKSKKEPVSGWLKSTPQIKQGVSKGCSVEKSKTSIDRMAASKRTVNKTKDFRPDKTASVAAAASKGTSTPATSSQETSITKDRVVQTVDRFRNSSWTKQTQENEEERDTFEDSSTSRKGVTLRKSKSDTRLVDKNFTSFLEVLLAPSRSQSSDSLFRYRKKYHR